jgi:Rrf2 family protein
LQKHNFFNRKTFQVNSPGRFQRPGAAESEPQFIYGGRDTAANWLSRASWSGHGQPAKDCEVILKSCFWINNYALVSAGENRKITLLQLRRRRVKISTKGRYALRMLLDLAEHKSSGFVALKDVARRQNISKKYLEQIVIILNRSDILRTNRGHQGGYMLVQTPDKYTVGHILRLTEGSLCPVACMDDQPNRCPASGICKTLPVWQGLDKVIKDYLDNITLQDILDAHAQRGTLEYHI